MSADPTPPDPTGPPPRDSDRVMQTIVDCRDAADELAVPEREQQFDVRVREKRVLLGREPLALRDA